MTGARSSKAPHRRFAPTRWSTTSIWERLIRMSDTLLEVEGLNAYYGQAHVLEDVSFEMANEPVAVIGRNGMGKSTLCAAIMGLPQPSTTGSIRFLGKEIRS